MGNLSSINCKFIIKPHEMAMMLGSWDCLGLPGRNCCNLFVMIPFSTREFVEQFVSLSAKNVVVWSFSHLLVDFISCNFSCFINWHGRYH